MKLLLTLALTALIFVPSVRAGNIELPGVITPPPCTENCEDESSDSVSEVIDALIEVFI